MCCIQYTPCVDANSFSIDTMIASMSEVDSLCSLDYIGINGASGNCNQGAGNVGNAVNKLCGPVFNPSVMMMVVAPANGLEKYSKVDWSK